MVYNLKPLRQLHGVSQQRLAEAIGSTQQSVNKYENHQTEPDIATLMLIADFFHTSVDFLIGHTEAQAEHEGVPVYRLNADEVKLVNQYRQLSLKEKDSIHLVMENYCKQRS